MWPLPFLEDEPFKETSSVSQHWLELSAPQEWTREFMAFPLLWNLGRWTFLFLEVNEQRWHPIVLGTSLWPLETSAMEVVLALRLKQMLHWDLVVRSTEDDMWGFSGAARDSQGKQEEQGRSLGKTAKLVLAGSSQLYGALPSEVPSRTSTALYSSKFSP